MLSVQLIHSKCYWQAQATQFFDSVCGIQTCSKTDYSSVNSSRFGSAEKFLISDQPKTATTALSFNVHDLAFGLLWSSSLQQRFNNWSYSTLQQRETLSGTALHSFSSYFLLYVFPLSEVMIFLFIVMLMTHSCTLLAHGP